MVNSCSDVCDELIETMCTQCPKYATCAYDGDLEEAEFNDQLIECLRDRVTIRFRDQIQYTHCEHCGNKIPIPEGLSAMKVTECAGCR
jgi:hypothetical protein